MANVEYRAFLTDDFDDVARIVGQTWHEGPDERDRWLQGAADLANCLRRTTCGRVAIARGRVVGFVLVRAGGVDPAEDALWARRRDEALAELAARNASAAADFAAYAQAEERIDARLLRESGCDERFEVVLFIMAPEARGLGAGGALFDWARDALARGGAREYFLYTDDSCTWGFYEHRGLRRTAEWHPPASARDLLLSGYYVYAGECCGQA